MRFLVAAMDHQISHIRDPGKGVGEDEDGILLIKNSVAQQQQRPDDAQPPEGRGNDHLLQLLSGIPLHHEAGEKHHVSHPADDLPEMPLDPDELAPREKEVV